jgi:hypothetical protein
MCWMYDSLVIQGAGARKTGTYRQGRQLIVYKSALRWASYILVLQLLSFQGFCQPQQKYDLFEIKGEDVVWKNVYRYQGQKDSLRKAVVQMIKSKFFTFNVIRNEVGYNGELRNYKINCKQYGRSYFNTPRLYWEGEWTGKFSIEVTDNSYQVTIYALYYEAPEKSTGYYKTDKTVKGRYIDAVTKRGQTIFKKGELHNISLMSQSLKDAFSLSNFKQFTD